MLGANLTGAVHPPAQCCRRFSKADAGAWWTSRRRPVGDDLRHRVLRRQARVRQLHRALAIGIARKAITVHAVCSAALRPTSSATHQRTSPPRPAARARRRCRAWSPTTPDPPRGSRRDGGLGVRWRRRLSHGPSIVAAGVELIS